MSELLLICAVAILLQELFHQIIDKIAWREPKQLKVQAKNLAVRFFTIITFPLVLFMSLVAALWLLPYLLLSKPYRAHLVKAHQEKGSSSWQSMGTVSTQFSDLSVPEFMLTPFKPILSFMDRLGQKRESRSRARKTEIQNPSATLYNISESSSTMRP